MLGQINHRGEKCQNLNVVIVVKSFVKVRQALVTLIRKQEDIIKPYPMVSIAFIVMLNFHNMFLIFKVHGLVALGQLAVMNIVYPEKKQKNWILKYFLSSLKCATQTP